MSRARIRPANLASMPSVLDVEQVSNVLRISVERVRELTKSGELHRLSYSSNVFLYDPRELLRLMQDATAGRPDQGSPPRRVAGPIVHKRKEPDMNPEEVRADLVLSLESAAEWRARKAVEYPEDARNARSAAALEAAASEVADLPADDPRLVRLADFYNTVEEIDVYTSAENLRISRHGFDVRHRRPGVPDATTDDLLASLVKDADLYAQQDADLHAQDAMAGPDDRA